LIHNKPTVLLNLYFVCVEKTFFMKLRLKKFPFYTLFVFHLLDSDMTIETLDELQVDS
jgi:hypothetical protein